ncbi:hypothetical protein DPX16_14604 [Anabarilius grahami]|uniref:Uncharacterized protein n=1 Tax=Anabarilius grahami TaxID=495550 RepID=A0A3N0YYN1_ANAGA|nr:hypothetical protein DPX16_14604 [Anabarilius grahami]
MPNKRLPPTVEQIHAIKPTRINQTETVAESAQPLRPVVLHPFLSFALFSVSFKWAWPKRMARVLGWAGPGQTEIS